jgi:hypothetical protein
MKSSLKTSATWEKILLNFIKDNFIPDKKGFLFWVIYLITFPLWFPLVFLFFASLYVFGAFAAIGIAILALNVLAWITGSR